jgi:hypothetical protein
MDTKRSIALIVLFFTFGFGAVTNDTLRFQTADPGDYVIVTDTTVAVYSSYINANMKQVKKMFHYIVKPNGKLKNDTTIVARIKIPQYIPEVDTW